MADNYLDFDLEIRAGRGQEYLVVARSSEGEAYSTFLLLFGEQTLEQRLAELPLLLRAPDQNPVQQFGSMLFQALFNGDIATSYGLAQRTAAREKKGLRVRLRMQPPELTLVPWELLFNPQHGEFVVLSRDTPLVRYLELPEPPAPLAVSPPLRILALSVSPSDMPPLKLARERERLEQALAPLRERGLMELHWIEGSTWTDVQQATWAGPWHVFHFIGHGEFEPERGEGCIIISDADDHAYRLSATQLARLLGDHTPLRLVLLNACEGAMGSGESLFASVGGALVRRGIPAVVAMQYAISDGAAMIFAQTFYGAVAHGFGVEHAMAEARKAVSMGTSGAEWATPVLYLRATDGFLFDLPPIILEPSVDQDASMLEPVADAHALPDAASLAPPTPETPIASTDIPNNLPAGLTPIIGRVKEIEALTELLLRPDVRLVTLIGPAGCGKSRLGLEVAIQLRDQFPDGVFVVRLTSVSDPRLALPTIAYILGVRENGTLPLIELLYSFLQNRCLLLLIDCFEHVLSAAPVLLDLLLAAPQVKLLVTSRAVLRISGEYEFAVEPLELPDISRPNIPEALFQYAAVALFVERAKAVRPAFMLTAENADAVAQLCTYLDGLPLAIELAAARIKLLTPQAMVQRLDASLTLLTGGARDLPERQRTLRGAIQWSYDLLEPNERILLSLLGVFAGGCTIEAAEQVCRATGDLTGELLDGLAALVDHSLLHQREDRLGEPRFSLLHVIREFALEQLEQSHDADTLYLAHATYYLNLAEQAERALMGTDKEHWLKRLDIEHNNLRAAMGWALRRQQTDLALRLGGALWPLWYMRGYLSEVRRWLEHALAAPNRETPPAVPLPNTRQPNGSSSDYEAARQWLKQSLTTAQKASDRPAIARVLNMLGLVAYEERQYDEARRYYEEALPILRALGYLPGVAATLANLGAATFRQNDMQAAQKFFEEALIIDRKHDNSFGIVESLLNLGEVALRQSQSSRAAEIFKECLSLSCQIGAREATAASLEGLASVAEANGHLDRAARLWGAAAGLRETIGAPLPRLDHDDQAFAVDVASAQAGNPQWEEMWAQGRLMPLELAITEALG